MCTPSEVRFRAANEDCLCTAVFHRVVCVALGAHTCLWSE